MIKVRCLKIQVHPRFCANHDTVASMMPVGREKRTTIRVGRRCPKKKSPGT